MNIIAEVFVSILLILGSSFVLIGSIGLWRLPDIFTRLHAPTKATTLGLGAMVVASVIYHSVIGGRLSAREIAVSLFLFVTAPIVSHVIAKAALAQKQRR